MIDTTEDMRDKSEGERKKSVRKLRSPANT